MPCRLPTRIVLLLCLPIIVACGPEPARDGMGPAPGPGYTRITPPNPDDPLDAHIYELDNGLTVYLSENHEEPRFHAEIAVRAGSKHDPADATGLAHYLEHLLFKGTSELGTVDHEAEAPHLQRIEELYEAHFRSEDDAERREIYAEINAESRLAAQYAVANEIDKVYNAMGASGLNAHTWHEETVYRVSLPANRLEQWATLESHRFLDPVFRLFHTELEVVYEEKNRTLDNRNRVSSYALHDLLYPNHPYGQQPTIGHADHLKNPSLRYIRDYYETFYVPNNMAIAISGAIDIEETIQVIAEQFSTWEQRRLPPAQQWPEEPIREQRSTTVYYPGQEEVRLAFRTVPNNHRDQEALMLLDMILDNRTAGLINLNLNQQQRVLSAGASPSFHNDHGAQQLWGSPREGQSLEEVEALLLEQLELLRNGEFEDWLLPAIINDFERREKRNLESNQARAANMRQAFINHADWNHHITRIQRMSRVTRQNIIDVANRYFAEDNYVVVYRRNGPADIPEVEKPQIDPVEIDPTRQSAFAERILDMPYEPIEPRFLEANRDYRIMEHAPGVTLYHADNPLNDLFTFSITIDRGTEHEPLLGLAAALLDKAGTGDLEPEELQKEWYRLGSNLRISAGANSTSISLSGLDGQFSDSLALMLELIRAPVSEQQILDELKADIFQSRRDQREDPAAISQALYLYNRYGEDSPRLRGPTNAEIGAVNVDDLLPLIGNLLQYEHSLSYTGAMAPQQVLAALDHGYSMHSELQPAPPWQRRQARRIEDNHIYVVPRETAQAQVRIEFPDVEFNEELSVASSLYNSYFGLGMSSVAFQELREARALAYSASARYAQGSRQGDENLMLAAIGTQNDKTVEATTTFISLLDDMPVSQERFEETRNALVNRYRTATTGHRQIPGTVRSWERLGLDGDPGPDRFARLLDSDLETVLNFQQEHVAGRPKLISIVGNLSRMDQDTLANLGTITEVDIDAIFID